MSEFVHLIGAEDVRSAGSNIACASDRMARASASFAESATRIEQALQWWCNAADRLTAAIESAQRMELARSGGLDGPPMDWAAFDARQREREAALAAARAASTTDLEGGGGKGGGGDEGGAAGG